MQKVDVDSYFSGSFAEAQTRFRQHARTARAVHSVIPADGLGLAGEPLEIDVAWLGDPAPRRAVLLVSGLHGVEGYTGSAIQLQALSALPILPSDAALVMIHVVNPWGMIHLARPNHDNIDLNRNFLLNNEIPPTPDLYRRLDPLLNPPTPPSRDFVLIRLLSMLPRVGFHGLKQIVAGGQYDFPNGLFFGGRALTPVLERYLHFLIERLTGVQQLVLIDVHTGLGRYGADFLFVEAKADEEKIRRLQLAFGARVVVQKSGSKQYSVAGSHLAAVEKIFPETRVDALCLEFGTFPPPWLLKTLRMETRWRLYGSGGLEHPCKTAMKRMFNPPNPLWRRQILNQGEQRLNQALRLLDL